MNIRLYNARILTMDSSPIFDGEIWIKNDKIACICTDEELKNLSRNDLPHIIWDFELDCRRDLLMPGFKNAHTHSPMTFLRSFADDVPLDIWLKEKIFPKEALLTEEDIYEFTRLAILEYIQGGITSIFDMYLMPSVTAAACMDTGMRLVLASGLNNFTSSIEQMEDEYDRFNSINPLISYKLAFHAEYTCNENLIRQVASLSQRKKAPVYMHLSETIHEVEDCKARNGLTPPMYLESMGIFEHGGGGYHCVHVTDDDMMMMRRNGLYVITNPASNLKLASGIAPISKYASMKIPVAIGTDGPASNNCLDFFREMYLVTALAKERDKNASAVPPTQVLTMATTNGAKAMGLAKADRLAKGKLADLILIDLHKPNMQPENNIVSNLVYSGNKSNVRMTMIGGKIVYLDGKTNIGVSQDEIYERCNKLTKRILNS